MFSDFKKRSLPHKFKEHFIHIMTKNLLTGIVILFIQNAVLVAHVHTRT